MCGQTEVCDDLRELQDLFRNKVRTLVGLALRLLAFDEKRRNLYLDAIGELDSDISDALRELEQKCRLEE